MYVCMYVYIVNRYALYITDLVERRVSVVEKLQDFEHTIEPILAIFSDPEVVGHLESGKYV